ncbi:YdcF family protein [Phenylobacterium soli]|uniref:YdcF family protein n=1 Tax=Phenylobacterium soli TaxID=2170551 RepID=A0A328ALQ6_9CAUL|nr:YdcF family protein [Phenylobacterium soli]RAK55780.1 YdcF family protein [Phenylobacterium soli]
MIETRGVPAIVIFGAAVLRDGRPSPSLARRIGYGHAASEALPDAPILCSGGIGRHGPSEAAVMAERLAGLGVDPGRLVLDEASLDTLQSVVATARFVRARSLAGCVVCSDRYHLPRIRLMLGALGVATQVGPVAPGRGGAPLAHWTRMRLRESVAIPYDLGIVLTRRRRLLAEIGEA